MALKQSEILSRADFDEAVVRLRLNVSEIAKETGIPRTYLSEFRNGDRKLRPEHQAKLRDYFESNGIAFVDQPAGGGDLSTGVDGPHPAVKKAGQAPCHFPFAVGVPEEMIAGAVTVMEINDARLVGLFKQVAEREDLGFGEKGDYTEKTQEVVREAVELLTSNYLIFRTLRGWNVLSVAPKKKEQETVADVICGYVLEDLMCASLIGDAGNVVALPQTQVPDQESEDEPTEPEEEAA